MEEKSDQTADLLVYKPDLQTLSLQNVAVRADCQSEFRIDLILPSRHHLNADAKIMYKVAKLAGDAVHLKGASDHAAMAPPVSPLVIPFQSGSEGTESEVKITADVHYCADSDKTSCLIKTLNIALRVRAVKNGSKAAEIACTIKK